MDSSTVYIIAMWLSLAANQQLDSSRHAYCNLTGGGKIEGWATFEQSAEDSPVAIAGEVRGLSAGAYDIDIHWNGDISNGCKNTGGRFNPNEQRHGSLTNQERQSITYAGNLTIFNKVTPFLSLYENSQLNVINRSLVIIQTSKAEKSHAEAIVACGTIHSRPRADKTESSFRDKVSNDTVASTRDSNIQSTIIPGKKTGMLTYSVLTEDLQLAEKHYRYTRERCCFDNLGCLYSDESWGSRLTVTPDDPTVIQTRFYLRTREVCFKRVILDPLNSTTFTSSTFDPARPTKIIIHGFTHSAFDPWVTKLNDALLSAGDFNVILVDWSRGSLLLDYAKAAANTRIVGLQTAKLIRTLSKSLGFRHSDVHIIGHSLGAQVAGYVGETLSGQIGRITGLDPAGPFFMNVATYLRLDPDDANFVEALHTNAQPIFAPGFGTSELVGHVDFFPNEGLQQPGCEDSVSRLLYRNYSYLGEIVACDHNRAMDLFSDAIEYSPMIGYECNDYKTFLQGKCNSCKPNDSSCRALFGLNSRPEELRDRRNVRMYFQTTSESPFALVHYRVIIQTDGSLTNDRVRGRFHVAVTGDGNFSPVHLLRRTFENKGVIGVQHGTESVHLMTSRTDVGNITRVDLQWDKPDCLIDFFCGGPVHVASIKIGQMSLSDSEARFAKVFFNCPSKPDNPRKVKRGSTLRSNAILPGETRSFLAGCR